MNNLPQSKVYKTFTTSVIAADEAKQLFANAKRVVACDTKGVDPDESRTMILKISSVNPDRSHDTVQPDGVVLDNYKKNAVVAAFHDYSKPAVGRALEVAIGKDYIASKMEFPPKGMNPEADVLHDLYKAGFQNAASIGFMPLSDGYELNTEGGYNFKNWELFEYSLVLVPDNPEALTIMRSKGFDPEKIMKEQEARALASVETNENPNEQKNEETKEGAAEPTEETTEEVAPAPVVADTTETPADGEKAITEDTVIKDLTVAQLKTLLAESFTQLKAVQAPAVEASAAASETPPAPVETVIVAEGEKAVDDSLTKRLLSQISATQKSASKADKELGLTLRLLKQIKTTKGGENK